MTPERELHAARGEPRHWSEDELFELAVGRPDPPPSAHCEACATRLAQVRAGLSRLRELACSSPARDEALAQRILAATVGESLGLRGDLRLVGAFVRERLRVSPLLRIAAAVLVIHVAALPVLAWIVLRVERPAPHFSSVLEPLPRESAFADPQAEAPRPLESAEPSEPGLVELDADTQAHSERWREARALELARLSAFDWPQAEDAERPSDAFALRLWVRSRQALRGQAPPPDWEAERERASEDEPAAARVDRLALELEIELDRVAQGADSRSAARLGAQLRSVSSSPSAGASVTPLARFALERAARLGVDAGDPNFAAPSGRLFDALWFEALRSAAPDANHGVVREWLSRAK